MKSLKASPTLANAPKTATPAAKAPKGLKAATAKTPKAVEPKEAPVEAPVEAAPVKPQEGAGEAPVEAATVAKANQIGEGPTVAQIQAAKRTPVAQATARTVDEILSGFAPKDGDWRQEFHGKILRVKAHEITRKGDFKIEENLPRISVLLAMPRDSDIGGIGPEARASGLIASHYRLNEAETAYLGMPLYLMPEELAQIV